MTGAGYHPGRQGNAYWRARAKVLAAATHCYLCGLELDFDAPPRSRWSPSVDHVVTLKQLRQFDPETRRKMATDPANMRPAHYAVSYTHLDVYKRQVLRWERGERAPHGERAIRYGELLDRLARQ